MLKEKFDLTGKIALVTGSTRGIGKAIGDALEEYGAKVIRHNTKVCDLSDPAAIEAFFAKLEAQTRLQSRRSSQSLRQRVRCRTSS